MPDNPHLLSRVVTASRFPTSLHTEQDLLHVSQQTVTFPGALGC